jgi:hypothetical protein
MTCGDLFIKNPLSWRIHNEGVSSNNTVDDETLKYELRTFVCQGEYQTGLARILQGYLDSLGKEQKAVWVSGFYGSGKSHLVKMLRFLWTNHSLSDGDTARGLAVLPQDILDLLRELDTRGKQGAGLHSAGGTLSAGLGSVRLRLLGIVLNSVGLPQNLSQARFILDLQDEGHYQRLQEAIVRKGKDPQTAIGQLYTSKALHEAYLEVMPHLGDVSKVSAALQAQYPAKVDDVTIEDMVRLLRRVLIRDGQLPCTVIVMDEVQQYINANPQAAMEVQELVESCSKSLDGRVLFVGTGQSALTDTESLQKLMGRFTIKAHLKDNDVEKVVRTVVLQKQAVRCADIEELVKRHEGELARQLRGTRVATRPEDDKIYTADYPLLPVRRRLWEHILHSVDPTGTQAQMRTQLSVTHEACRAVADKPLGAIIPADFIYDQLANGLVNSGELQKRFQEIVEEQKEKPDGLLRSRICALTFLINKLPRESADIGVRATADHLADLLSDDLSSSPAAMRQQVPVLVQELAVDGVLMEIEGEFRLQTTEGAAWEAEYGKRRRTLLQDESRLAAERGQQLSTLIQEDLRGVSVLHGQAKEKRKATIHQSREKPPLSDGVTVWVRDGFQESESAVLREIQSLSTDDATIHVFIPKARADELKQSLASSIAADEALNARGNPTSSEGKEARSAMVTRLAKEGHRVKEHLGEILQGARVFLSGGQELSGILLKDMVEKAGEQVLDRLFPKFRLADHANWHTVWTRAKAGNADALSAVNYTGNPNEHAVAKEILAKVGSGRKGSDVVSAFTAVPYGWPKDAIDAVAATLVASGHLSARRDGKAVLVGDMSQRDVGLVDLRVEHPVLTAAQKLRIRKLFQRANFSYKPGDELAAATGFVQHLKALARAAGGEPPAPEAPRAPEVIRLESLAGNDLMFALFEQAEDLDTRIDEWTLTAKQIEHRLPAWAMAQKLMPYVKSQPGCPGWSEALEAIRSHRSLLAEPDPLVPVVKSVTSALRLALKAACKAHEDVFEQQAALLDGHPAWQALPKEKRATFLSAAGAVSLDAPEVETDTQLVQAVEGMDLEDWRTQAEALPVRFEKALSAAIRAAEPTARRVALPPATIRSATDLDPWLAQVRAQVLAALADGPVII